MKHSWQQVGDQARYKNKHGDYAGLSTYTCDAFVHKDNVFSCNNINLSYSFSQNWFKRATGLESLSISASYRIFFIFLRLNEKEEQLIRSRLIRISQFHVHFKDLHYDEENDKCDRVGYIAECLYGLVDCTAGNFYDCRNIVPNG